MSKHHNEGASIFISIFDLHWANPDHSKLLEPFFDNTFWLNGSRWKFLKLPYMLLYGICFCWLWY